MNTCRQYTIGLLFGWLDDNCRSSTHFKFWHRLCVNLNWERHYLGFCNDWGHGNADTCRFALIFLCRQWLPWVNIALYACAYDRKQCCMYFCDEPFLSLLGLINSTKPLGAQRGDRKDQCVGEIKFSKALDRKTLAQLKENYKLSPPGLFGMNDTHLMIYELCIVELNRHRHKCWWAQNWSKSWRELCPIIFFAFCSGTKYLTVSNCIGQNSLMTWKALRLQAT